jgi:hypothetical protein
MVQSKGDIASIARSDGNSRDTYNTWDFKLNAASKIHQSTEEYEKCLVRLHVIKKEAPDTDYNTEDKRESTWALPQTTHKKENIKKGLEISGSDFIFL